jgi:hypothetical protein
LVDRYNAWKNYFNQLGYDVESEDDYVYERF